MWDVLSGRESGPKYARLSEADRRAVVEILRETLQDLPGRFRRGRSREAVIVDVKWRASARDERDANSRAHRDQAARPEVSILSLQLM